MPRRTSRVRVSSPALLPFAFKRHPRAGRLWLPRCTSSGRAFLTTPVTRVVRAQGRIHRATGETARVSADFRCGRLRGRDQHDTPSRTVFAGSCRDEMPLAPSRSCSAAPATTSLNLASMSEKKARPRAAAKSSNAGVSSMYTPLRGWSLSAQNFFCFLLVIYTKTSNYSPPRAQPRFLKSHYAPEHAVEITPPPRGSYPPAAGSLPGRR